jgi:hypothetical protein
MVGAIMNSETMPLRVKAFRVIDRRDGNYSRWIVIEYIDHAKFQVAGFVSFGESLPKEMKTKADQDDVWKTLNALKDGTRISESNQGLLSIGDSIDAAIAQAQIRQKELWDWARHGKAPSWATTQPEASDQRTKPTIMARPGVGPSEEEFERMTKEVWEYAGGKRLKWKSIGHTPAGRKCDVLTFDGSEEILVGPTSIETPTWDKRYDSE